MKTILSIILSLFCLGVSAQDSISPVGKDVYLASPYPNVHAHLFQIKKNKVKKFMQKDIIYQDFSGERVHVDSVLMTKMQSYYYHNQYDNAAALTFTFDGIRWAYVNPRGTTNQLWYYYLADEIDDFRQQWVGKTVSLALTPDLERYDYYNQLKEWISSEKGIDFTIKDIEYKNDYFDVVLEGVLNGRQPHITIKPDNYISPTTPSIQEITHIFANPQEFRQEAWNRYDKECLDSISHKYTKSNVYIPKHILWINSYRYKFNMHGFESGIIFKKSSDDSWLRDGTKLVNEYIPCKFSGFSTLPCYQTWSKETDYGTHYELFAKFSYLSERNLQEQPGENYSQDTLFIPVDTTFFHQYLRTRNEFLKDSIMYAQELENDIKIQNLMLGVRKSYTDQLWKNGRPNPNFTTEQLVEAKLGESYRIDKMQWPIGLVTVYNFYESEEKYYFYRNKLVAIQFGCGRIIRNRYGRR